MAPVYNSAQLYQPDAVPNPAGILPQFKTNTFDFTAFDNARLAQDAQAILNKNNSQTADLNAIKLKDAQSQAATDEQIKQALVDKYSGTAGTEIDQSQAIDSMIGQAISAGDADRAIKLIQAQATIEQKNSMAASRKQQELLNAEKTKDLRDPAWRIIEQNTAAVTPGTYEANVTPQGNAQPSQGGPSVEFSRKALDLQPGEKTIPQDIADSYRQNLIATRDPDAAKAAQSNHAKMLEAKVSKDMANNQSVYESGQALKKMSDQAQEGIDKLYNGPGWLPNVTGRSLVDSIEQYIPGDPFGMASAAKERIAGRSNLDTLKPDALRASFVKGIGALSDTESKAFFSKSTSSDNSEAANRELEKKMEQAAQMQSEYADARSEYMLKRGGDSRGFDKIWNAYKERFPLVIQDRGTGEWVANMGRPKLADLPIDALIGPTSVMNSGQSQNKLPSNADGSPLTREQFNALMGGK